MIRKVFLFLLLTFNFVFPQTGGIKGKVTSENLPLQGVNIIIVDSNLGTVTDSDGRYFLENIPIGLKSIRFSTVGYETKFIDVEITRNRIINIDVNLIPKIIEVDEVKVIAKKTQAQKDTRTSLIEVEPRAAKILPGAAEDVMRTLQSLPGVLAPNDFTSQLIVRGSGPDQNLIVMDDVEIFNPYRLYGVISMFNPETVSDISLITGGFPARYGDRLSAVLDVTNREGYAGKYLYGNINASVVTANLVLEGKNPFGITGSWLFNSRRTYYDLILEPIVKKAGLIENDVTFPNFYDFQTKFSFELFNKHKFLVNGIYSRDGVDIVTGGNRKTPDSISVGNVTKNDLLSFAWHYSTENIFNKLTLSWYNNSGTTDLDSKVLDPSLNRDIFNNVIPDTISQYLLSFSFNSIFAFRKYSIDDRIFFLFGENEFEAGVGFDLMRTTVDFELNLDPQLRAILNSNPNARSALSNLKNIKDYSKFRAFFQTNISISKNLFFQPSLRFDYYEILKKPYLAPRISLSYALDNISTVRAMWGIYYQSPGYEKIRDQNILFDFSPLYTEKLNAEKAIHYILSFERYLTTEWNAKVEAYFKDFTDLIIPKKILGTKYHTEIIPGKDPRFTDGWSNPIPYTADSLTQIPVNGSSGRAYGVEFLLAKLNLEKRSRINGWISYSLAFANRVEDGKKIPFRFDQRHTLNIVLNYKFNDWLETGIRWQYGSGFPYTEPIGIKPRIILKDKDADGIPETPEIAVRINPFYPSSSKEVIFDIDYGLDPNLYNARKPAYHRLDIRVTFFANFWSLDWTFYLDVINAYNHSNVVGYNYFINPDLTLSRKATTMLPILPTLGLSIRF